MPAVRTFSEIRLVNGSAGDPALYIDYPGKDGAYLFDAGENGALDPQRLGELQAVFITHHHIDHFIGFDRITRANLDKDKTLHVFGPANTIDKVHRRIKSYDYTFFPFMKLVLEVCDVLPGRMRSARLECAKQFPEPVVVEREWKGPVIYENEDLMVETVPVDHTVPCLAFALVEKGGFHPDPVKLANGALRPGTWVSEVLALLRSGTVAGQTLEIQGGRFPAELLGEQYFAVSRGSRVAYVTDTAWSEAVQPGLVKLAQRAQRLYCDSFYSKAQARQAAAYRHMMAPQAGELARLAKVEELILMHFAPRYEGRYQTLIEEAREVFPRVSADLD